MKNNQVMGENYRISPFTLDDINNRYIDWLNDPDINQYISTRDNRQSLETVSKYIKSFYDTVEQYIWGIYTLNQDLIGTVVLVEFDRDIGKAEFGVMIGDTNYWGKSASEEALRMVFDYAFNVLELNKITGRCYSTHIGMVFTMKNIGMTHNEILKSNHKTYNEKHSDMYTWFITKSKWSDLRKRPDAYV